MKVWNLGFFQNLRQREYVIVIIMMVMCYSWNVDMSLSDNTNGVVLKITILDKIICIFWGFWNIFRMFSPPTQFSVLRKQSTCYILHHLNWQLLSKQHWKGVWGLVLILANFVQDCGWIWLVTWILSDQLKSWEIWLH